MPNMTLDEFFTMYHEFKEFMSFLAIKKILSFLDCSIKLIIYMLFNSWGR